MESICDTVESDRNKLQSVHTNIAKADEELIYELIKRLAKRTQSVLYLDDLQVHTIDRDPSDDAEHHKEKLVCNGDATARFYVIDSKYGEAEETVEIKYRIYAGSNPNGGFVYDPIEVEVIPKE